MTAYSVKRYKANRFGTKPQLPCRYCGKLLTRDLATVDHKNPLSRGGKNNHENLTIACGDCNVDKGDMTFEEFKQSPSLPLRCRLHLNPGAECNAV